MVLGTMASSMFTFIVFVSSALLVAVQLASAQLTPRIIALVFRDPVTKFSLTVFVFTFHLFPCGPGPHQHVGSSAYREAGRIQLRGLPGRLPVPDRPRRQSPASERGPAIGGLAGTRSRRERLSAASVRTAGEASREPFGILEEPTCTVTNLKDGVVLAVDIQGLVSMAQSADCVIEMMPQVGDFAAMGDPLFRVHGEPRSRRALAWPVGGGRSGTHPGTRPGSGVPDHGRHCLQGAFAGHQSRPNHGSPGHRPDHHLLRNVGSRHLDDERPCQTLPAGPGWSTGLRPGRISSNWPLRKSAISAARAFRSRGVAGHAGGPDSDSAEIASRCCSGS